MTIKESNTTAIIPVLERAIDRRTKPGVSAKTLYVFLELNAAAYARWTKKNIVNNVYAAEHEDWELFQPDVVNPSEGVTAGRPTQDYILSIDFAKRLAMMSRSSKGEEARQYFLDCERRAMQLPDPVEKYPELRAIRELIIATAEARDEATLARQEAHAAEMRAIRAETKADLALEDAHRMTVEEFVFKNGLYRQFPSSQFQRISNWLKAFCEQYALSFPKSPVYGKPWDSENSYPLQAIAAWLRYEQKRPHQHALISIEKRKTR